MSKKLHEDALGAAVKSWMANGKTPKGLRTMLCEAIAARDAHLKAHGWRLTPREPTNDMLHECASRVTHRQRWTASHDAAPDFPGDDA